MGRQLSGRRALRTPRERPDVLRRIRVSSRQECDEERQGMGEDVVGHAIGVAGWIRGAGRASAVVERQDLAEPFEFPEPGLKHQLVDGAEHALAVPGQA